MGTEVTSPPQRRRARARGSLPVLGPAVYGLAVLALRIALGVGALTLAYLLFGLFSPQSAGFVALKHADKVRILGNVAAAGNLLALSCLAAALIGAVVYFGEEITGYVLALVGAALYVGVPFCLTFFGDTLNFGGNAARARALAAVASAGFLPLLIGGALVTFDVLKRLIALLRNRPLTRDNLRYGGEANAEVGARPLRLALLGKCWEGRFCRDFVRVHCPIFQKRKACWRVKYGCYCEDEIVSTAAARMAGISLPMAPDGRYNFANESAPGRKKVELTPFQKRERCRHCVIYLDHQRQKYTLLMPIVIGGVGVAALVFSPLIRDLLRHGLAGVEMVMAHFSWGDQGEGISFRFGRPSPTVEWVLVGGFAIMALSKALEAVEWAIFKAKI